MYIHRQSAYLLGRQRHVSNHIDTAVMFVVIKIALKKKKQSSMAEGVGFLLPHYLLEPFFDTQNQGWKKCFFLHRTYVLFLLAGHLTILTGPN